MDNNRRKFIKILLIGSASFMVGKIIGPLFSKLFLSDTSAKNDSLQANNSTSFRVIEDAKTFSVYDDSGEEIFQIDKGA